MGGILNTAGSVLGHIGNVAGAVAPLIPGAGNVVSAVSLASRIIDTVISVQAIYGVGNGDQKLALATQIVQTAIAGQPQFAHVNLEKVISDVVTLLTDLGALPTKAGVAAGVAALEKALPAAAPFAAVVPFAAGLVNPSATTPLRQVPPPSSRPGPVAPAVQVAPSTPPPPPEDESSGAADENVSDPSDISSSF